jgi:predicted MPP superfamily phosphohydrolase
MPTTNSPVPIAVQCVVAHVLRDAAFAGYRVAIISDFHIAPWRSTRALADAINTINTWQPDLVALVGDYGYSTPSFRAVSRACYRLVLPRVTRELARLQARDGVCAVLGNHDLDAGAEMVEQALAAVGLRVLRNSYYDIARQARLRVVGIDDIVHGNASFDALDDDSIPPAAVTLMLSHHPDFVLRCQRYAHGGPFIVVSGHTHGGQIALPRVGAPITLSRAATHLFPAGFVPNENATLYVTRGLGEQIPLRVGAPREVTLLELAQR